MIIYISRNSHDVRIWGIDSAVTDDINETGSNGG